MTERTRDQLGVCQDDGRCRDCPANPYFGFPGGRPVWPWPAAARAEPVEPGPEFSVAPLLRKPKEGKQ